MEVGADENADIATRHKPVMARTRIKLKLEFSTERRIQSTYKYEKCNMLQRNKYNEEMSHKIKGAWLYNDVVNTAPAITEGIIPVKPHRAKQDYIYQEIQKGN